MKIALSFSPSSFPYLTHEYKKKKRMKASPVKSLFSIPRLLCLVPFFCKPGCSERKEIFSLLSPPPPPIPFWLSSPIMEHGKAFTFPFLFRFPSSSPSRRRKAKASPFSPPPLQFKKRRRVAGLSFLSPLPPVSAGSAIAFSLPFNYLEGRDKVVRRCLLPSSPLFLPPPPSITDNRCFFFFFLWFFFFFFFFFIWSEVLPPSSP